MKEGRLPSEGDQFSPFDSGKRTAVTPNMINITLCIPCSEVIPAHFLDNIIRLMYYTQKNQIATLRFSSLIFPLIAKSREFLAYQALKQDPKPDYLLWLDTDIIMPQDTVKTLLSADKDIIGGIYYAKIKPYFPILRKEGIWEGKSWNYLVLEWENNLFKTDFIGFGCMLIKREVFEKVQRPWFEEKIDGLSEDLYFCKKARETGYDIWATDVLNLKHGYGSGVGKEHYLMELEKMKKNGDVQKLTEEDVNAR